MLGHVRAGDTGIMIYITPVLSLARRLPVLRLALVMVTSPAVAQHQVYDPLPPPGSAYVRFVNSLANEVSLRPDFLPPQQLGTLPEQRVTPFYVVEKVGGRDLRLQMLENKEAGQTTLHAEPGNFVTVIVEHPAGGDLMAVPLIDQTDFNQSRARLSFYNATPACGAARLAVDPDGPAVFQDIIPGTAKARSVNPVVARVRASCTGLIAPVFGLEGLEPGGMYSIWLMMQGAGVAAFITRDTTTPWKP
jgi:hypothetical protein